MASRYVYVARRSSPLMGSQSAKVSTTCGPGAAEVERLEGHGVEADDVGQVVVEIVRAEAQTVFEESLLETGVVAEGVGGFETGRICRENAVLRVGRAEPVGDAGTEGGARLRDQVRGRDPIRAHVAKEIEWSYRPPATKSRFLIGVSETCPKAASLFVKSFR